MIRSINEGINVGAASSTRANSVQDAAAQFEALLIAQLLKTARSGEGWMGTGEDTTAASAIDLAEEQFASAMAAQGGIGLARMVTQGLKSAVQAEAQQAQEPLELSGP